MFQSVEYDDMRENLLQKQNIKFFIPRVVEEIFQDSEGCTLLCSAREYKKEKMPPLFIQDDLSLMPSGESTYLVVRLEAYGPATIRVRMTRPSDADIKALGVSLEASPGAARGAACGKGKKKSNQAAYLIPQRTTEMQVATEPVSGLLKSRREDERGSIDGSGSTLVLTTGTVEARIDLQDWNLSLGPAKGSLEGSAAGEEMRSAAGPAERQVFRQYTRDEHAISHLVGQQDHSHEDAYDGFESFPFALGYDPESGQHFWTDAVELEYDEHFYGFGEKFGPLDKLGQEVLLWHTDTLSSSSAKSYKNIPFFMSNAGYGVYLNTSAKCRFLMGSYHYKAYQMVCHEEEVDYFFIYGPSMKDILPRYTDITGKSPMLPKWSFGTWMSKNTYRTQDELLSVAHKIREKHIPCDVMHLDVGWFEHDWMCDYEFSSRRFPDPRAMTEELKGLGYRLSVWQLPYFKKENKLYPEAKSKGLFAKRPDGRVSTPEADGVVDFSNPEAVEWYQGKLRQLLNNGVSVIKVDFGESTEKEAVYKNGIDGGRMHNLYPLLYNRAAFEVTEQETGEGIIWARSAWAGSQRYPLHWGGDSGSDFHGMYHSLRGGLSFGLSGFVFWSHDVGGYYGKTETDVYIRWAQMGMFSSHMRMHGTSSREPWHFGAKAEAIFLYYARLRYRLLPYIWRQAEKCVEASLPMVSPLLLEFAHDPTTWTIDDQYMFGESVLVAPVFSRRPARKVYLPEGEQWYDFWTDAVYSGGQWIEKETPLDTLPLFIRGGSILETGPGMNHTAEKEITHLDLHDYTGLPSFPVSRRAEEDTFEGSTDIYGGGRVIIKECCSSRKKVKVELEYQNKGIPSGVVVHGQKTEIEIGRTNDFLHISFGSPGIPELK